MDELGNILREARETRGFTLAQVQAKTRINVKFLDALESGRYDELPTSVHVRGFLRNYARFLDLDPHPLLDRYELSQSRRPSPIPVRTTEQISNTTPIPPREDQPFFNPVNVELGAGSRRDPESTLRLVIIAALLIALALVGNRFIPLLLGGGDGTEALTNSLTETLNGIINTGANQATDPTTPVEQFNPLLNEEPIVETGVNNTMPLPTLAPTRQPLPVTLDRIQLRLEITERTWLRVTTDGEIRFEGLAKRGDGPFEWEAVQEARLLSGNAAGVFITINDVQLGRLGGRGEIIDEIWTTTGNQ